MIWCVFRCRRSLQRIYSTLYSIKPGGKQHSISLDQLLDPGNYRGGSRNYLTPYSILYSTSYSIKGNPFHKTCWSFKAFSD